MIISQAIFFGMAGFISLEFGKETLTKIAPPPRISMRRSDEKTFFLYLNWNNLIAALKIFIVRYFEQTFDFEECSKLAVKILQVYFIFEEFE